jgi:hypothetical protein
MPSEAEIQALHDDADQQPVDTRQQYSTAEIGWGGSGRVGLVGDDTRGITGLADQRNRDTDLEFDVTIPAEYEYEVTIQRREDCEWIDGPDNAPETAEVPDGEYVAEFNVVDTPDGIEDDDRRIADEFAVVYDHDPDTDPVLQGESEADRDSSESTGTVNTDRCKGNDGVFASETQRLAEGDVEDGRITTRVRGSNDGITTDGSRLGALNNVTADMVRSPTSADRDIPGPDGETASSTIVFQASDDTATDDTVRDWNDPDATGSVQERPQRTPNTPLEEPKRSTGDVEASVWWDEESIGADRGNDAGSDSSSSTTSTPGSESPSDASESGGDAESTSDSSDDTANDSPRDDPDDNPTDEADDKAEGEEGEKDTADSANESSSDRDDHDSTESVKHQRRRVLIAEARASSRETSAEQTQDQG